MKKYHFLLILAFTGLAFTACEDVPAPYIINQNSSGSSSTPIEPAGDGTQGAPFNVAAAQNYIKSLEADVNSPEVYITGIVSMIKSIDASNYGNAEYYISDDGTPTNQLLVYRGYSLNGNKFKSDDEIKEGDKVVILGKVVNYRGNTPEVATGSKIVSINAEGNEDNPSTGEAKGSGTVDDPYNAVAANQIAESLSDNDKSEIVYIKGKVVSIKEQYGTQYGNATFYISDDGTSANQFYIFRALYLDNKKYTSGTLLAEGDDVVICGQITKFVNDKGTTLETAANAAYLYSLKSNGGGGETPSTETINVAKAIEMATGGSTEEVTIEAIITAIKEVNMQYGNATYTISDDNAASNKLTVFRGNYFNGTKFTAQDQIQEGDKVVLRGKLTMYNNEPQVNAGSKIISINGETINNDDPNPDPTPTPSGSITLADFTNGDFESWEGDIPTGWQSTTSASQTGVLSQSTDARNGNYSVKLAGDASGNKRLAYQEMTLEAGEYTITFYAKGSVDGCSIRPGYVPVTDGKVGSYVYGDYTNDIPASGWTQITHTFNLASTMTVNLVIMNPGSKTKPGHDILIDDYTIVKN